MGHSDSALRQFLADAQSKISKNRIPKDRRMYAIVFDLEQAALEANYHNDSFKNAYGDIRKVLERHGFSNQQGSVYFGNSEKVDAVSTVLAVMDLASTYPWFEPSVTDIRMLRIEDNNDLLPAVKKGAKK